MAVKVPAVNQRTYQLFCATLRQYWACAETERTGISDVIEERRRC